MSVDPSSNFNPYSPPTADTDGATWPENTGGESDFKMTADRGSRLGAAIIDTLLYLATLIPAGVIAYLFARDLSPIGIGALMLILGILPLAIYQWYLLATTGQTLAKKWLRIRVVKMDGSPVDFMSAVFLRAWVPWVILQVFGYLIGMAGAGGNVA